MSLKEDFETLEPAEEIQKAFDQSAKVTFGKEKMHPWTISRHTAALTMGSYVLRGIGPAVKEFLVRGVYDNVFRDVVIVMWLCSLTDDAVLELNCQANLKTEMAKAFDWAGKVGLVYGSPLYMEGVQQLDAIVTGIFASFFGLEENSPARALIKKDPGLTKPRGKSKSPSTRRKPRVIP